MKEKALTIIQRLKSILGDIIAKFKGGKLNPKNLDLKAALKSENSKTLFAAFNFKKILTVTKKETTSYLNNPASYIVLIVFLIIWQFIFFRSVFIVGEASMKSLFSLLPWFLLVFSAAVTMGSISKEKDEGTLESVLTQPIGEFEYIIAKFLGAFLFVCSALLFTIPIAVLFSIYGQFDWGVYIGQLIAAILMAGALVSLGIFVSTLFNSQIASLLVALGSSFLLVLAGSEIVTISLPSIVGVVLERLSLYTHYSSVSRGVIDLIDVSYFLAFTLVFLLLAHVQLLKNKYGDNKGRYSGLQFVVLLIIGAMYIGTTFANELPVRADLTAGKLYTLSVGTKNTLNALPGEVTLALYASNELPAQYSPILRETKLILGDYKFYGGDKLKIEVINPASAELEQQASADQIQRMQFNVIGDEELQLKTGYFGLAIKYQGQVESIPFVQSTADLEYELTSLIRKLTNENKKTLAFLTGHGERDLFNEFRFLEQELSKQYNVISTSIPQEEPFVDPNVDVLVIVNPVEPFTEADLTALKVFVAAGRSLVFMVDGVIVSGELNSSPNNSGIIDFIYQTFAVNLNTNMVYDKQSHEELSLAEGPYQYVTPYELWVRAFYTEEVPELKSNASTVVLPWASSLTYNTDDIESLGYKVYPVLTTSNAAGVQSDLSQINLNPTIELPRNNLSKLILGAALLPAEGSGKGRVIVLGESEFLIDSFLQRNPENLAFTIDLMTWVGGDEALTGLQVKQNIYDRFLFNTQEEPVRIKYIVMGISVIVPTILAAFRFIKRNSMRKQKYEFTK